VFNNNRRPSLRAKSGSYGQLTGRTSVKKDHVRPKPADRRNQFPVTTDVEVSGDCQPTPFHSSLAVRLLRLERSKDKHGVITSLYTRKGLHDPHQTAAHTGHRQVYDSVVRAGGTLGVRVGLDTRAAFLDANRGFGRVTRSLADALLRLHPGELVLFVPHGAKVPQQWYPLAARIVALRRPRRGAFLFDGPAWRWTLSRVPVDVLHLPAWTVPRRMPVPVVATFHDATPFRFRSPREPWRRRRAQRAIASLTRADAVHAVSHYAASELLATIRVPPEKVSVVHLGVAPPFTPARSAEAPRHLLFVGGGEPHKNLSLLITMLASEEARPLPPLVVVGSSARHPQLAQLIRQGRARAVVDAGDDALAELYRGALALLLPSRNEGFGLPALEAMACGCPVVAARAGAIPEICGDAAVLLDPDQPSTWCQTLLALLGDAGRRGVLIGAGRKRAAAFTWERTACTLTAVYLDLTRAESSRS
jgi:glycosyltransferase involved in cell wall biosynthesis